MQTLRLKYNTDDLAAIKNYCRQYSSCLHYMYNRICDNKEITQKELRSLTSSIQHIDQLDSHFINSCVQQAVQLYKTNGSGLIFGGKKNFMSRIKGLLSKDEYKANRFKQIYSIGESNQRGNRKFRLQDDLETIIFQPNKNQHITLRITDKRKVILSKLYLLQEQKKASLTYELTDSYVYLSYDETVLSEAAQPIIENRILGIDLNPNYIGWSIVDWKGEQDYNVVTSGVYSVKEINLKDKDCKKNSTERIYFSNKRKFELLEVAKEIQHIALHYQCEAISIEQLKIETKDKGKGKSYNKLCNNVWIRNAFIANIKKRCNLYHIRLIETKPQYSSFIGNMLYRETGLPDMVLSSIEMSRRAYEFINQYIRKTKDKIKNIIFPQLVGRFKSLYTKSLEEFSIIMDPRDWLSGYNIVKNTKLKYRVSLDSFESMVFRKFSNKSLILCYKTNIK